MISTVTTSTVSTVATLALAASLGLIAVMILISFLVAKELSGGPEAHPRLQAFSRVLNVAIIPLFIAFSAIVTEKLLTLL